MASRDAGPGKLENDLYRDTSAGQGFTIAHESFHTFTIAHESPSAFSEISRGEVLDHLPDQLEELARVPYDRKRRRR